MAQSGRTRHFEPPLRRGLLPAPENRRDLDILGERERYRAQPQDQLLYNGPLRPSLIFYLAFYSTARSSLEIRQSLLWMEPGRDNFGTRAVSLLVIPCWN